MDTTPEQHSTSAAPRLFALPHEEADRLAARFATSATPASRVKEHLQSMGFRPDGVSLERVMKALAKHKKGA